MFFMALYVNRDKADNVKEIILKQKWNTKKKERKK